MLFKALSLFLTLSISNYVSASVETDLNNQEKARQITEQNIRLQEQNSMLKSSIENTNSIYFSALGFAATFLIAFLGINVYFVKNRADEERKYFEKLIRELNLENHTNLSNYISQQMNSNMDNLKQTIPNHTKAISDALKQNIEQIYTRFNEFDYNLTVMKYENETNEQIKLTYALKVIQCSETLKREWKTSKTLSEIKKLLESGIEYSSFELSDAFNTLKDIAEPNKKLALEVENLILKSNGKS